MRNLPRIANTVSLLLVLLVGSELFVINQNFRLKKRMSEYSNLRDLLSQLEKRNDQLQENIIKMNLELSLQGESLLFLSKLQFIPNSHTPLFEKNPYFPVVFCFSITDCETCLRSEMITWNAFAKKVGHGICQVIGVTDTTGSNTSLQDLSQTLGIRFPVFAIAELKNHLLERDIKSCICRWSAD